MLMTNSVICLLMGGANYPALRSAVQLDQVLTPSELRDPVMVAQTQAVLQRVSHNGTWLVFVGLGLVSVLASGCGLAATRRRPDPPAKLAGGDL